MKHTQLVNIAPFTTSNSGNTTKKSRVSPIMCMVSNIKTTKKSEKEDLRQDLNTQILADLNAVPKILRHFSVICIKLVGQFIFKLYLALE